MLDSISTYIYTVYKQKSISKAAKELYISQPALSSALKREEERLGFKIFNRKTLPLTLTSEGKCYIDALEKMRHIERQSLEKIDDMRHANGGTLRIGTSTHLSYYVIPKILKEFQKLYPKVDIHITITDTASLFDLLKNEMADIIFTSEKVESEEYKSAVLLEEHFVVAMPRQMVTDVLLPFALSYEQLFSGEAGAKAVCDLSLFHDVEFIYTPPQTLIQKKRKILFGKDDLPHYITSNATRQQFNYNLMCAGFGALLTTDANLATMPKSDDYCLFILSDANAKQNFSLVSRDESSISQKFVSLALEVFGENKPLKELLEI